MSPSTSFSAGSAPAPARGRGRPAAAAGTRMPCTRRSAASSPTASSTSACVAVSGSSMPCDTHARLVRLLVLVAHVDLARLVVADEHGRQAHRRRAERRRSRRAAGRRSRRAAGCRPSGSRRPACARSLVAHDRPTISPFSSKSMIDAAGVGAEPGHRAHLAADRVDEAGADRRPRPRARAACDRSAHPSAPASPEIDRWVLAMHTGRLPKPLSS